jgi:hypothetical protein
MSPAHQQATSSCSCDCNPNPDSTVLLCRLPILHLAGPCLRFIRQFAAAAAAANRPCIINHCIVLLPHVVFPFLTLPLQVHVSGSRVWLIRCSAAAAAARAVYQPCTICPVVPLPHLTILQVHVSGSLGHPLQLQLTDPQGNTVTADTGSVLLQQAAQRPLAEADVVASVGQLGDNTLAPACVDVSSLQLQQGKVLTSAFFTAQHSHSMPCTQELVGSVASCNYEFGAKLSTCIAAPPLQHCCSEWLMQLPALHCCQCRSCAVHLLDSSRNNLPQCIVAPPLQRCCSGSCSCQSAPWQLRYLMLQHLLIAAARLATPVPPSTRASGAVSGRQKLCER